MAKVAGPSLCRLLLNQTSPVLVSSYNPGQYFLGHSLKLHAKIRFPNISYPSTQYASECCYHVLI